MEPGAKAWHRIIAVTPAGRRRYLDILLKFILADASIEEWHLWDNCRAESDRAYINQLAANHEKIIVKTVPAPDGTNKTVNRFYSQAADADAFYIKMDDDLVYLPPNFGARFYNRVMDSREGYIWWSPMVVNNAICTWALQQHGRVRINAPLTAQAACPYGFSDPEFTILLHSRFLQALKAGTPEIFQTPDFDVSASRFSINCIGFFGADVEILGDMFCPAGVDDEEWISAVLPFRIGKRGRVIGDLVVSHFAYYTQERWALQSGILDAFYAAYGLTRKSDPPTPRIGFLNRMRSIKHKLSRAKTKKPPFAHKIEV